MASTKPKSPPKRALKFLRWFCADDYIDEIEGDIIELYFIRLDEMNHRKASFHFWIDVWRHFRPWAFKKRKRNSLDIQRDMLKNYVLVATRNIRKKSLYSAINAFGLSIAIAFCVLVYLFIKDENSFDKFHANGKEIYNIHEIRYDHTQIENQGSQFLGFRKSEFVRKSAYMPAPLSEALKEEMPDVKYATRFNGLYNNLVSYDGQTQKESDIVTVDKDFFKMFSFEVLKGNPDEFFATKEDLVITPAIAEKYFGNDDPLGKVLNIKIGELTKDFKVVGVIESLGKNSSLFFTMLTSIENKPYHERNITQWRNFSYPTFIQLHPETNPIDFDEKLQAFCAIKFKETINEHRISQELDSTTKVFELGMMNIENLHLNGEMDWHKASDPKFTYILSAIGILILVIACINYISLAITSSSGRKFEVGVRKVMGAERRQILIQFGVEAQILSFLSMLIGGALVAWLLPYFNNFTNKNIELGGATSVEVLAVILSISILVGILAGSYPALYLSGFKPLSMLKAKNSKFNVGIIKPLVILQFGISAFLIISSIIMFRQMEYIAKRDLGYNGEKILNVETFSGWNDEGDILLDQFKSHFVQDTEIKQIAGTSISFNDGWSHYGFEYKGEEKFAYVYRVDPNYLSILDLKIIKGRGFDDRTSDKSAIIVNESLAKDYKLENPIGERIIWNSDSIGREIIGVVKDYHFLSLEHKIEPMFLTIDPTEGPIQNIWFKMSGDDIPSSVAKIETAWKQLAGDKPFNYTFLDEDVAKQYESYKKWNAIMGFTTCFAILIACLGLFGLSGISAVNRTKEVGIRKVLGASVLNIVLMLNKQYLWLSMIAFILATPLSWYIMKDWLGDFQYSINIGWELFGLSFGIALLVAIATVSYHSIKAALANPVESIKSE